MKTIDEMIAVMTAYKNGQQIEYIVRRNLNDVWEITFSPKWNWGDFDYRIARGLKKAGPRYDPWTFETCPREGWLRRCGVPSKIWRINVVGLYQNAFSVGGESARYLVNNHEYSADGLTNWTPAGRRVEG